MIDTGRRLVRRLLERAGWLILRAAKQIHMTSEDRLAARQEKRAAPWFADPLHETLREDYPLGSDSLVFDVGGFRGEWASAIFSRFACHVHVFEPVSAFSRALEWRFAGNPRITVHPLALGAADGTATIHVRDDVSSTRLAPGESHPEEVAVRDVARHVEEMPAERLDLLKLNIEGDEYALLERLLDAGATPRVRFIQVQFYEHVPHAEERRNAIHARLRMTHDLMWSYPFVWESWALR